MSRARSAVAVRTTIDQLREAAVEAYGVQVDSELMTFDNFDDVVDFCRPLTEELGGEPGSDAWYFWQHGEWAVMGDLGIALQRDEQAHEKLSARLGEVVVAALDTAYEYAYFAFCEGGKRRRRLMLEEGVFEMEGLPVKPERGHHMLEFNEEECERIWSAYDLPTFEYDPLEGHFQAIAIKR